MVEKTPPRRFRVEHHADEEGRRIIVHVFHAAGEKRRYMGQADIEIMTPLGLRKKVYNFEIEVQSLEEAFDGYEEAWKAEVEKLKREAAQQTKIIVPDPGAGPPSARSRKAELGRGS